MLALRALPLMLTLCATLSAAPQPTEAVELEELRDRALSLVNEAREEHALDPLERSGLLDEAAQNHAEDMLERNYYAHVSPEGETVQDRYRDQGGSRWKLVAENIATCTGCPTPPTLDRVERFQEGWMNSPEHRENVLAEGLENFGFGIAGDSGTIYAVQTFAGPGEPPGLPPDEEPAALDPAEQTREAVQAANRAREREGLDHVEPSDALSEVARQLLPEGGTDESLVDQPDNLFDLLPEGERADWSSLRVLAAACGGCGTLPTAADIRHFIERWSSDPQDGGTILQRGVTDMGFAMLANGEGRKIAVSVLGQRRTR
ncbi:CAP domain-containing protein [Chelativorans sp. M5D2P16]|uniref:CAP domain-containing protein n=1 Tax=Chelativorans sp. M5D2P16 TaxID=3095678 RepID=UPI002ACAFDED|nr:CAP domain-containing protein [Chelativorans sp. M5D2P16]MDZ5697548.1 CAP domain-containing protein [Chelativorans sp. M5D2P16]